MKDDAAKRLIRETFEKRFDEVRFSYFIRELLNGFDERKAHTQSGQYLYTGFRESVEKLHRLGTYADPDGQKIDILVVYLAKDHSLDYARTMQRNLVAHHLKKRDYKNAALVAYVAPSAENWRFSLVRMDYELAIDEETGRVNPKEKLTPARRFSFLVGENEPNHTAQQQLIDILKNDRKNPTLDALEKAFEIETVTKQFFADYKARFLELQEELEGIRTRDAAVAKEFADKNLDTANFAKKLLGQIVFLYFLQKKGWLGVERGDAWGAGPKNFLSALFKKRAQGNFFDEVLEPFFYEALAIERPDNFYAPLNCKIPFLNGGLFEPIHGYDWKNTKIPLDNALFAKIFETFDLYNFTVREDEPLEKEVAVDPEMLGKVFENLLEVRDRKSKGAFYTPREIVHYMCQESLIQYLHTVLNDKKSYTKLGSAQSDFLGNEKIRGQLAITQTSDFPAIAKEDIAIFIRKGELALEYEAARKAGMKSQKPVLPKNISEYAEKLDQALADVKICDPAIGSGAFPVGMMQEIVRARAVLTDHLSSADESARSRYNFKRHAIQESIYGVDIDPGAVEIAKLRLWLSLVVDEEDYETIQPLPNLDYKIVAGNSLLGVEKDILTIIFLPSWKN